MGSAEQCPFVPDLVEAAEEELPESPGVLHLAEYRLNGLLA